MADYMKYLKMVGVLAAISAVSGGILGPLYAITKPAAQMNALKRKQIPGLINILRGDPDKLPEAERDQLMNQLLADRKELIVSPTEDPVTIFVLKKDNQPFAVALQQFGKGYGGDIGVVVAFNLQTGDLEGIGVTSMSETPGVGTRTKTEAWFSEQFRGMKKDSVFKVKKDGGVIDGVSGATKSSRGVATAVSNAKEFYDQHHDEIMKLIGG
jgi:Na+-translocating ferredoxin:NAD+ oxidoreductase subunit G